MERRSAFRPPGGLPALLVLLAIAAAPTAARAHTDLVSSDPASGDRLEGLPATVELSFSGPVDPRLATVVLTAPGGRTEGESLIIRAEAGASVLQAAISSGQRADARAGTWTVDYRVTSTDGHPIQGSVKFAVACERPATREDRSNNAEAQTRESQTAESPPAAPTSEQRAASATWPYVALVVVAILALAGAVTRRVWVRRENGASRRQDPAA